MLVEAILAGSVIASPPSFSADLIDGVAPGFKRPIYAVLNDAGQATGVMTADSEEFGYAIQWQDGVLTEIGLFIGFSTPSVTAMNNDGDAIGTFYSKGDGSETTWLWVDPFAYDLEFFVEDGTEFFDLSDGGHMIGHAPSLINAGFIWQFGDLELTPLFPGSNSSPSAVNGDGIVGGRATHPSLDNRGFLWKDGKVMTWIDPIAGGVPYHGIRSDILDINEQGDATGYIQVGGAGEFDFDMRAMVLKDGVVELLATPQVEGDLIDSRGLKIAENGIVLQRTSYWDDGTVAEWWLTQGDRIVEILGAQTDLEGFTIETVHDMNGLGQVLVGGDYEGEFRQAVLTLRCPADFDGDGELTILDFVTFQAAFVAGDADADCNGDGELDILDFVAFQGLFAQGC